MNYQKIYNQLILKRTLEIITYGEKHHIIPKCLGGTNSSDNIVVLTCREHIMAHILLWKIYPNNKKIIYAFVCMCNMKNNPYYNREYITNSKLLAKNRELQSTLMKERIPNFDKTLYTFINKNTLEEITLSKYEFSKYSGLSKSEVNNLTNYNHRYSHNWGLVKNNVYSFNRKIIRPKPKQIICEKCNIITSNANYKRWHGEKCKSIFCKKCNKYFSEWNYNKFHKKCNL